MPDVGRWQREHADKLTISLISWGGLEENEAKATEHGLARVVLEHDWKVSKAYRVKGIPSAVLASRDGMIGSPVAGERRRDHKVHS